MGKIEVENTKIGGIAAIYTLSSGHCCRDAMLRVLFGDKRKATTPVRHCGLDPQSPFIRFVRREASRLYISGDSDFRQNDGNGYGDSDLRQNDEYRYTGTMSRMGLNMYNPLQAKRSWGYKMMPTLSELRSSSIYRHADLKGFSQIRKKICGHLFQPASFACLLYPSLRGTKQSRVSCFWIASYLAMTKPVNLDSDRKMGYAVVETRCFASHHTSHHTSHHASNHGIDDIYNAYNVYDWETRSIASLHIMNNHSNHLKLVLNYV